LELPDYGWRERAILTSGGGSSTSEVWLSDVATGQVSYERRHDDDTRMDSNPDFYGTNISGTAASLTAGTATVANGLASATTTVVVSAATAPSANQVLTASSSTAASWVTPSNSGERHQHSNI